MHSPALAAIFLAGALVAGGAGAATFQIDFSVNGSQGATGTFEAPQTGGAVSNFMATISGVVFDTQIGGGAYEYDPAAGDFVNYTGFPSYTNSVASAGVCAATLCFLEIYPLPNDPEPGDYLAIDEDLNNIDDGTKYAIDPEPIVPDPPGMTPVPLPAGGALLLAALLGTAALRRRG